uniref:Uncharacterized protein n=1 Tax=Cucumis melo TaxID=3656 RepID=A0A9I9EHP6_CUCME
RLIQFLKSFFKSVAQFGLHEGSQYVVAFGHQKNTGWNWYLVLALQRNWGEAVSKNLRRLERRSQKRIPEWVQERASLLSSPRSNLTFLFSKRLENSSRVLSLPIARRRGYSQRQKTSAKMKSTSGKVIPTYKTASERTSGERRRERLSRCRVGTTSGKPLSTSNYASV